MTRVHVQGRAHVFALAARTMCCVLVDSVPAYDNGTRTAGADGLLTSSGMRLRTGRPLGAYEVRGSIGAGGMGEVYRARDTKLERDVAIKILPAVFSRDPDRRARFDREARLLAALNHPHIAAIYGVEDSDGIRGLVLELVEGETLGERIATGPLPIREVLRIAQQVADAQDAAHEKGIVHRDETSQHQDHAGRHRQGARLRPGEGGQR